jgi:hypothetical protein
MMHRKRPEVFRRSCLGFAECEEIAPQQVPQYAHATTKVWRFFCVLAWIVRIKTGIDRGDEAAKVVKWLQVHDSLVNRIQVRGE